MATLVWKGNLVQKRVLVATVSEAIDAAREIARDCGGVPVESILVHCVYVQRDGRERVFEFGHAPGATAIGLKAEGS